MARGGARRLGRRKRSRRGLNSSGFGAGPTVDVDGGRAKSEDEVGSGGLAAMFYGAQSVSVVLDSDTRWAGKSQEGAGKRARERSWGSPGGVSSSTIEYGRSQTSSSGLVV